MTVFLVTSPYLKLLSHVTGIVHGHGGGQSAILSLLKLWWIISSLVFSARGCGTRVSTQTHTQNPLCNCLCKCVTCCGLLDEISSMVGVKNAAVTKQQRLWIHPYEQYESMVCQNACCRKNGQGTLLETAKYARQFQEVEFKWCWFIWMEMIKAFRRFNPSNSTWAVTQ